MDLIVTACRTLANRPRLRLLRAIYAEPGRTVNAAAEAVKLTPNLASRHLTLLDNLHFIQAVPSGREVQLRPALASHTSQVFLRAMLKLLQDTLGPAGAPPETACDWRTREDELMHLFTTYTHLRRLLLLRKLAGANACTTAELSAAVGMSDLATARHLDKLLRRGVVSVTGTAPPTWRLAQGVRPALRRRLLTAVLHAINAEKA